MKRTLEKKAAEFAAVAIGLYALCSLASLNIPGAAVAVLLENAALGLRRRLEVRP